jgi:hypothetical protein
LSPMATFRTRPRSLRRSSLFKPRSWTSDHTEESRHRAAGYERMLYASDYTVL